MSQVFISYSSADRDWAKMLERRLTPHLLPYRDDSRLVVARPFQKQLFEKLDESAALLIIWSKRVRDMQGEWKEWVITERERFRLRHEDAPIVYLLLDETSPQVDGHTHKLKLKDITEEDSPENISEAAWEQVTGRILQAVCQDGIKISCYVLACTDVEFSSVKADPNLQAELAALKLDFDSVLAWYRPSREDWHVAGVLPVRQLLKQLEDVVSNVLKEEDVPEPFRNNQVIIESSLTGLWDKLDSEVSKEIDRLSRAEFCWVFIDPLSLYHPTVGRAANRLAGCREKNQWLNVFILDPLARVYDRSNLRRKLAMDFASLYSPLVKPKFLSSMVCLGGVDVWHADDFERVFRDTVRLRGRLLKPRRAGAESGYPSFGD